MVMDDEQLRSLLSSLAVLAQQGPIPVQAYSMVVCNHSPEALAEQLHQRWLADGRFAPIAANIVLHIHKTSPNEMAVSSCVLALLLNDYRKRLEVRSFSSLMFRNSVKCLFAMYPIYTLIDKCVSKCFVKPMFNSLDMLIDNNPDGDDVETMGVLLSEHGKTLHDINSYLVDRLVVKVRAKLCSNDGYITTDIRKILLHVNDLWSFGWSELLIPEALTMSCIDLENEKDHSDADRAKEGYRKARIWKQGEYRLILFPK